MAYTLLDDEPPKGRYTMLLDEPISNKKAGGFAPALGRAVLNAGAGAIRGAGSIGATLLTPWDMVAGNTKSIGNPERRQAMTDALQSMGADPESLAFQGGKGLTEVAGTLGVGGGLARGAAMLPGAGRIAPLIDAIGSAGFKAGGAIGLGGLAARTAGGAITGGASAGVVDPGQAGMGAAIGGAMPGAAQVAGTVGRKVGQVIGGPQQSADLAQAVQQARAAGYVIPPTQAKPTLINRMLEGISGKITTAQNASAQNQAVTADLAAKALGLQSGTKLTPDILKAVRQSAGQAYDAIGSAGVVVPGKAYTQSLDDIAAPFVKTAQAFPNAKPSPVLDIVDSLRSASFDAGAAVEKIKMLRTAADDGFRTGNTDIARASKAAATALEDALEAHLLAANQPQLLQGFRDARQLIAKTYSVEKALNPTTGAVDARKLAAQLSRGKPLSGDLRTAAEFAARFPKAAQTVEGMGSLPQTSPLDWVAALTGSAATSNPLPMLGVAIRPGARALTLSPVVQNGLLQRQSPSVLNGLLAAPEVGQFAYRAAPIALTGR